MGKFNIHIEKKSLRPDQSSNCYQ